MQRSVLLALFALTLPASGCISGADANAAARADAPVRVATVAPAPETRRVVAHGVTRSTQRGAVGFVEGGRLVARPVELGDVVEPGQVLARLDPAPYRHQAQAARAQVRQLEAQLFALDADQQRLGALTLGQSVSQGELDRITAQANAVRASLDAARAAAAEGRARVLWWGGKRRAALRQARALPDDTLARAIADDRPRELTVVAGVRATDGTSPRAGLRASMRTGRWTLYGSADRSTTGWALATSDTGWASIGGVAHTLGEHLVVDGSARSWWSSEGDTHAVAARVTTPAGSFAPYLGGMAGTDDLRLGELGLRVGGDERWASLGGTHRFTADPLAAATSVAVAGGASAGPASVRLDLTRGWFAPGPLDSLGGAVEVATGRGHAVGVEVSHLRGWLTRTDVMGTWSLSF